MSAAYAVIADGGKQYLVQPEDKLNLELKELEVGAKIQLEDVLLHSDGKTINVGKDVKCKVEAEVLSQGRGKKIEIIKFKRRKHYMKRQGHRQYFTQVKITSIS